MNTETRDAFISAGFAIAQATAMASLRPLEDGDATGNAKRGAQDIGMLVANGFTVEQAKAIYAWWIGSGDLDNLVKSGIWEAQAEVIVMQ